MLLTREQLQERLIALHRASLELIRDVSLEHLLERIAQTACEQAGARYAALGVLDEDGRLKQFITVGMTSEEIKRMGHPPVGRGLIGELMHAEHPLRVPVIAKHPHSSGFPPHHPQMTSFLGVPIRAGERQLGQIYLTDKISEPEFTADDEKIIQMLAAYAAAAIQNARLYEEMREHDAAVTRRNEDLALVNNIASTLTASLQLDEILNKTLALVMQYMKVEAGEIFLLEEDKQTLRMVLHRGEAAEAFWTRNLFLVGEGQVGMAAQLGIPILVPDLKADERFMVQHRHFKRTQFLCECSSRDKSLVSPPSICWAAREKLCVPDTSPIGPGFPILPWLPCGCSNEFSTRFLSHCCFPHRFSWCRFPGREQPPLRPRSSKSGFPVRTLQASRSWSSRHFLWRFWFISGCAPIAGL